MRIAITGSEGFIGKATRKRYEELGHEVIGLDKSLSGNSLKIDLNTWNVEQLTHLLRGVTTVFHAAAQTDVRQSIQNPLYDFDNNVSVTMKLLQACVQAQVRRFIFCSSAGAINNGDIQSFYGLSKSICEQYVDFYAKQYGLETITLRYSNVYGPSSKSVISKMQETAQRGGEFTIFGDGLQTRDYIYISDIVEANVVSLTCPFSYPSNIYNISTGIGTSLLDLTKKVPIPFQSFHAPAIPGEVRDSILTPNGPLNWNPSISLEEGLRLTFEYYKAIY